MGIKLIILLALLVGVLYSLHLLVKDYQALTASRLLRFFFKRDVGSQNNPKPSVRWKRILFHDPIQCARYVYCDLGARATDTDVRRGFTYMLTIPSDPIVAAKWIERIRLNRRELCWKPTKCTKICSEHFDDNEKYITKGGLNCDRVLCQQNLEPREQDQVAWELFKDAYQFGKSLKPYEVENCRSKYFLCPFQASLLFDLIQYLVQNDL